MVQSSQREAVIVWRVLVQKIINIKWHECIQPIPDLICRRTTGNRSFRGHPTTKKIKNKKMNKNPSLLDFEWGKQLHFHNKTKWEKQKHRFPLHRGNFWLFHRDRKEGRKWDGGFLNKNCVVHDAHLQSYQHWVTGVQSIHSWFRCKSNRRRTTGNSCFHGYSTTKKK